MRRVNDPWRSYSVSGLSQTRSLRRKQRARCQSPSSLPVQSSPCGSPRLLRSASQPLVLSELHDGGVATRAHCHASAAACAVTAAAASSPASALSGEPPACTATVRLLLPCATSLSSPLLVQGPNVATASNQREERSRLLLLSFSVFTRRNRDEFWRTNNFVGPTHPLSTRAGGADQSVGTGRNRDAARESPLGDGLGVFAHGRGGDAGWH